MPPTAELPPGARRFVVTGGAGFIGLHLVERLARLGAGRVTILDNLRYSSLTGVQPLLGGPVVELVRFDLGGDRAQDLQRHLQGADCLFHLAAEKHNQAIDAPTRVMRVNIQGTFDLLEQAAHAGVGKVVFASSLYAHGRMQRPALDENDRPEPTTVYGISKLAGEHLLGHFAVRQGLRSTALRLFFVYGPRQFGGAGYKSVIVKNFERLARGEPPHICGDGEQALDYVYVDDVVDALVAAAASAADGALLHIGSGSAITVNQLTGLMLEVAGSALTPVHGPADATAGTHRACAPGRARELLGWSPAVSLRVGLGRVYQWMTAAAGVSAKGAASP